MIVRGEADRERVFDQLPAERRQSFLALDTLNVALKEISGTSTPDALKSSMYRPCSTPAATLKGPSLDASPSVMIWKALRSP